VQSSRGIYINQLISQQGRVERTNGGSAILPIRLVIPRSLHGSNGLLQALQKMIKNPISVPAN